MYINSLNKILGVVLLVVLLFGVCILPGCGETNSSNKESNSNVSSKQKSEGASELLKVSEFSSKNEDLVVTNRDTAMITIFDIDGKNKLDTEYVDVLEDSDGRFFARVKSDSENIVDKANTLGLVSMDGTKYIENATLIEKLNDKLYKVTYATEQVKSTDDAIAYIKSNYFDLSASEDDVLFGGYIQIYNIETKTFLPDIKLDNTCRIDNQPFENNFIVETRDDKVLYDVTGKKLGIVSGCFVNNDGYIIRRNSDGTSSVYNEELKLVKESNKDIQTLSKDGKLMVVKNDDMYEIYDESDKLIYSSPESIDRLKSTPYFVTEKNDRKIVIDNSGREVITESDNVEYISCKGDYLHLTMGDEKYAIYGPKTGKTDSFEKISSGLCIYNKKGENAQEVCLIDKNSKATYSFASGNEISPYFLYAKVMKENNGNCGLIDLRNGDKILDFSYDEIKIVSGYIQATKSEGDNYEIEIYKIQSEK